MPPTRGLIGAAGFGRGAFVPSIPPPAGNSSTKRPSRRRAGFDMRAGHGAGQGGAKRPCPGRARAAVRPARDPHDAGLMTPGRAAPKACGAPPVWDEEASFAAIQAKGRASCGRARLAIEAREAAGSLLKRFRNRKAPKRSGYGLTGYLAQVFV